MSKEMNMKRDERLSFRHECCQTTERQTSALYNETLSRNPLSYFISSSSDVMTTKANKALNKIFIPTKIMSRTKIVKAFKEFPTDTFQPNLVMAEGFEKNLSYSSSKSIKQRNLISYAILLFPTPIQATVGILSTQSSFKCSQPEILQNLKLLKNILDIITTA